MTSTTAEFTQAKPPIGRGPIPAEREDNRAVRVNGDSKPLVYAAIALVVILAVASFCASAGGLLAVAEWAQLHGPAAWLVPVTIDGAILVFTACVTVKRSRREPAKWLWFLLGFLTATSCALQVAHVTVGQGGASVQTIVGAFVAGLFPALLLCSTEALISLAVNPPPARRAGTPRRRPASARPTSRPRPSSASGEAAASTRPIAKSGDGPSSARGRAGDGAPRRSPSKIDDATRAEAIQRVRSGESQRAVAEALGVSRGALQNWLRQEESA